MLHTCWQLLSRFNSSRTTTLRSFTSDWKILHCHRWQYTSVAWSILHILERSWQSSQRYGVYFSLCKMALPVLVSVRSCSFRIICRLFDRSNFQIKRVQCICTDDESLVSHRSSWTIVKLSAYNPICWRLIGHNSMVQIVLVTELQESKQYFHDWSLNTLSTENWHSST